MIFENLFRKDLKILRKIEKRTEKVNGFEDEYKKLTDEELKGKTAEFRKRLADGEMLDDIAEEAFAVAKEATRRVDGITLHLNQIETAYVLNNGDVAEMKTGQGKTNAAVPAVYLNALTGKGVHIITVNEYLAERDSHWVGKIYEFLGLTVGLNLQGMLPSAKRRAYECDVTFMTSSEDGFDYLRDNMVLRKEDRVQRPLNFALVDEVDSILIDDARTPLIISGNEKNTANLYTQADRFVKKLKEGEDFEIDIKSKTVALTREGMNKAEKEYGFRNLYDSENTETVHYISQALKANYIMHKDVDYMVENNTVFIIDPNTGRKMVGREWSDGLHQAVQAKERIAIKKETNTVATITYQNFFRLYSKLAGMTGTAKTEEEEFLSIYNMRVIEIPSNEEIIRVDNPDLVFATKKAKYAALADEIEKLYKKRQPVLVGTISVETSETISRILKSRRIRHEVLNAKNHAREAEIIAKAGYPGSVTIATNMAGRGTDIKLTEESRALGGLAVLGSERHESRRIDNQLRGRSGRQGDPGYSRFYVSLEDDLMMRFGNDSVRETFGKLGDAPIENNLVSKAISSAQKRVEGSNFDLRKAILDYDMVMAKQRETVYEERNFILDNDDIHSVVYSMFEKACDSIVNSNIDYEDHGNVSLSGVVKELANYGYTANENEVSGKTAEETGKKCLGIVTGQYEEKIEPVKNEITAFEKTVMLRILDRAWMNQIDDMTKLRDGIGLRSYGQTNPLQAYKEEGFAMFEEMIDTVARETVSFMGRMEIRKNEETGK